MMHDEKFVDFMLYLERMAWHRRNEGNVWVRLGLEGPPFPSHPVPKMAGTLFVNLRDGGILEGKEFFSNRQVATVQDYLRRSANAFEAKVRWPLALQPELLVGGFLMPGSPPEPPEC